MLLYNFTGALTIAVSNVDSARFFLKVFACFSEGCKINYCQQIFLINKQALTLLKLNSFIGTFGELPSLGFILIGLIFAWIIFRGFGKFWHFP